jgi:hypothetical protein
MKVLAPYRMADFREPTPTNVAPFEATGKENQSFRRAPARGICRLNSGLRAAPKRRCRGEELRQM